MTITTDAPGPTPIPAHALELVDLIVDEFRARDLAPDPNDVCACALTMLMLSASHDLLYPWAPERRQALAEAHSITANQLTSLEEGFMHYHEPHRYHSPLHEPGYERDEGYYAAGQLALERAEALFRRQKDQP